MKTCFLIAPIGESGSEVRRHADMLLQMVVEPACIELGYQLVRADRLVRSGSITQDILRLLLDADVVIADISNSNPNVMYELGVRHAVGRPVIVMAPVGDRVPFDIASYRALLYRLDSTVDAREARKKLVDWLKVVGEEKHTNSPVGDVFRQEAVSGTSGSLAETGTPPHEAQEDYGPVLRSVSERLASIEESLHKLGKRIVSQDTEIEYTRDVFVVHGHDGELKNELARFLERLEFRPIILHEQPDRGQTIVQKLQYEASRVGYAFILHTPDDEGRQRGAEENFSARSRQNVVFEHGMFVGQFTSRRVCAIVREGVEFPSDLSGVIYKKIPRGGGINSIAFELVAELRAAGYVIDANKLA